MAAQSAHDLATYFSTLPPRPAGDGDTELVATGRTIYQQGMPEDNIVACVVCHGPNAEGVGQIPRLGGLAYSYLQRTLEQWGQGYHLNSGPPMPDIASKLSPDQIAALAAPSTRVWCITNEVIRAGDLHISGSPYLETL